MTFSAIKHFLADMGTWGGTTAVLLWLLGSMAKFGWYKTVRSKFGLAMQACGVGLNASAGKWLGPLWNPIEQFLCDWLVFGTEQLAVGMRKDNDVSALAAQHDRLKGVGSESRVAVILEKLEKAIAAGAVVPSADPAVQNAIADMKASAEEKLLQ